MAQFAKGQLPFALTQGGEKVGEMCIVRVYWYNPITPGDTFVLTDIAGDIIVQGRCEVANQSQWFDFSAMPVEVTGVAMGALSSGTLFVYPA